MSGPPQYRHLWRIVFQNFVNSLKPRQVRGNDMGKDYIGNAYFEIPAERRAGKRRASRWYEPAKGGDFERPVPAEWEAWLRHRRPEPPTEDEIAKNLAVAALKKENGARLERERLAAGGALPAPALRGPDSFPKYDEYAYGGKPK